MDLQIVNPITWKGWDQLVLGLPRVSFFYSSAWAKVLRESYGYTPMYFAVIDDKCRFLLPMMDIRSCLTGSRGVSLPFSDCCIPFVGDECYAGELFAEVVRKGAGLGWKSMEFRGGQEFFSGEKTSQSYYLHTLKLGDEPGLRSQMKESCLRNIKQASTKGVRVVFDRSATAMSEFCRLNCITRRKHGLPPQPDRFFKQVYASIIQNDMGVIVRARWNHITVAAAIFFYFGDHALYKYGASDVVNLPLRANNLLMWEAIRYFAAKGFQSLDLGKTEISNAGLRRYKLGWGAEEQGLKYYKYNLREECFKTGRPVENGWYTKVFSKMPLPLLASVGRVMYRHVG